MAPAEASDASTRSGSRSSSEGMDRRPCKAQDSTGASSAEVGTPVTLKDLGLELSSEGGCIASGSATTPTSHTTARAPTALIPRSPAGPPSCILGTGVPKRRPRPSVNIAVPGDASDRPAEVTSALLGMEGPQRSGYSAAFQANQRLLASGCMPMSPSYSEVDAVFVLTTWATQLGLDVVPTQEIGEFWQKAVSFREYWYEHHWHALELPLMMLVSKDVTLEAKLQALQDAYWIRANKTSARAPVAL
eukprot:TRINITY_DN3013_c0_g1_i2.p1 TRINITY_DN3013_c0_g1~~TRINITY_DN3013_c0_g1_i2.p1  ORF type:complete len:247 (+),score=42.44 TRINITY_DN3013_c0_g1_i2:119-859(+)